MVSFSIFLLHLIPLVSAFDHWNGVSLQQRMASIVHGAHQKFQPSHLVDAWGEGRVWIPLSTNVPSQDSRPVIVRWNSRNQGSEGGGEVRQDPLSVNTQLNYNNEYELFSEVVKCTRVSEVRNLVESLGQNTTFVMKDGDGLKRTVYEDVPLNVAVAAFCRIVHLSGQLMGPKRKRSQPVPAAIIKQRILANTILPNLFWTIKHCLDVSSQTPQSASITKTKSMLSTSSILHFHGSVARLVRRRLSKESTNLYAAPSKGRTEEATAVTLTDALLLSSDMLRASVFDCPDAFIRQAGSHRLSSFLWAMTALRSGAAYESLRTRDLLVHDKDYSVLLNQIANRLAASDAIGAAAPNDYCTGLWCFSKLGFTEHKCFIAFLRRLRKGAVRIELRPENVLKIAWACSYAVSINQQRGHKLSIHNKIHEESRITCTSLLRHFTSMIEAGDKEAIAASSNVGRSIALFKQADALGVELKLEQQRVLLGQILEDQQLVQTASLEQISFLLRKQAEIGIKNGEWVKDLGVRMNALILDDDQDPTTTLSSILRSVAILFPGRQRLINQHFLKSGTLSLTDHYIQELEQDDLGNLLWSLARCKYDDATKLLQLGKRALHEDILGSCTASTAGKILWAFAAVSPRDVNSDAPRTAESEVKDELHKVKMDIFEQLGPRLLDHDLTTNDMSAAMWALAKVSYPLDRGVFDDLARMLSSPRNIGNTNTRNLVEALWACGKMASWEDPLREQIEFGEQSPPPYLDCALRFADELSLRTESMSTKDTAQCIWAMAKLEIHRRDIIRLFASKAKWETINFNAVEVANVLWGLSKIGYSDPELNQQLVKRILDENVVGSIGCQEAANVLYALGKLKTFHEEAFEVMCNALMRNLADATPQAIANALWAHEVVGKEAPQQLFDSWAEKKLGIIGPGSLDQIEQTCR